MASASTSETEQASGAAPKVKSGTAGRRARRVKRSEAAALRSAQAEANRPEMKLTRRGMRPVSA